MVASSALGVLRVGAVLLLALALLIGLPSAHPARAAAFTVNDTTDTVDANPGDGVCETGAGNGVCTLRAAIQEANALADADTINLPAGTYTLSAAGAFDDTALNGDLDITQSLSIGGAGANSTIIDGNGSVTEDRVFTVDPSQAGISVIISGLTIQNGNATIDFGGGAIANSGNLTLDHVTIKDSSAPSFSGGGIRNFSTGTLTIRDSSINGNNGFADGGGISNGGTLTLERSTVSGNSAGSQGGGIDNGSLPDTVGNVTVINSTISNNISGGNSGGIFNNRSLTITNSTISGNAGVQIVASPSASTVIKNTILSNNSANYDCSGTITSQGHNLEDVNSCGFSGPGDLINTDPQLGPLADNGGPTQTRALLAGSPAIDAGSSDCPPPATDQRGVPRPHGPVCDIGAFEVSPFSLIQGDGTCDGVVTIADLMAVLREVAQLLPGADCPNRADVNCNSSVDGDDGLRIVRYLAQVAMTQPSGCAEIGTAVS